MELVSRHFFWPQMRKFINEYIRTCETCARTKPARHLPHGPLKPLAIAEKPWASISMDFIVKLPASYRLEPGSSTRCRYDSILVIVDRLTKYAYFLPCTENISAEDLATLYISEIYSKHGLPVDIVSDRGPQFRSNFWTRLLQKTGTKSSMSTAYHPQSDGQTERVNQCLEQYLRVFVNYEQDDWVNHLPLAQFSYNNASHSSTGTSPFYANYGYHPTTMIPKDNKVLVPKAEDRLKHLKEVQDFLKIQLERAQQDQSMYYDRSAKEIPHFEVGQEVWLIHHQVKTNRPTAKLDDKRLGPFKISKKVSSHAFELVLPPSMKIHNVFHVRHLEPCAINREMHPRRIAQKIVVDGEAEWEVERILKTKMVRRKRVYLVRWKNCGKEDDSWEPLEHLGNAKKTLEEFNASHQ